MPITALPIRIASISDYFLYESVSKNKHGIIKSHKPHIIVNNKPSDAEQISFVI